MSIVAKAKKTSDTPPIEDKPDKAFPSRDNYTHVYIPKSLAKDMQDFADEDDRSLSYMVRKACEEYRDRRRKAKSKPSE